MEHRAIAANIVGAVLLAAGTALLVFFFSTYSANRRCDSRYAEFVRAEFPHERWVELIGAGDRLPSGSRYAGWNTYLACGAVLEPAEIAEK